MPDVRIGDKRLSDRFWRFVELDTRSGCWLWTGALRRGYATYWAKGRNEGAHRFAYERLVEAIPDGQQIDHLCHDPVECTLSESCPHRRCVNPRHLRASTARVNTLRGGNPAALHAQKTHCVHGHEFTEANTYHRPTGGRACKACADSRRRIYYPPKTRTDIDIRCAHGHDYTPETLYLKPNGQRQCRICNRLATQRFRGRA